MYNVQLVIYLNTITLSSHEKRNVQAIQEPCRKETLNSDRVPLLMKKLYRKTMLIYERTTPVKLQVYQSCRKLISTGGFMKMDYKI